MCMPKAPAMPAPIVIQQPAPPPVAATPTAETPKADTSGSGPTIVNTPTPQAQDATVQDSRDRERRRRLQTGQDNNTMISGGGLGDTSTANTGDKTLLGQ